VENPSPSSSKNATPDSYSAPQSSPAVNTSINPRKPPMNEMKADQLVLTCRVERELYNKLLRMAGAQQLKDGKNISVSSLVRDALEEFTKEERRGGN
jgi:hypothetical protein